MFENTKEALLIEIIKCAVCIDPAPLPGSGLFNVVKAMKRDIQKNEKWTKYLLVELNLSYFAIRLLNDIASLCP